MLFWCICACIILLKADRMTNVSCFLTDAVAVWSVDARRLSMRGVPGASLLKRLVLVWAADHPARRTLRPISDLLPGRQQLLHEFTWPPAPSPLPPWCCHRGNVMSCKFTNLLTSSHRLNCDSANLKIKLTAYEVTLNKQQQCNAKVQMCGRYHNHNPPHKS